MKRCPECRRDYYDETLLYCLDDGSRLLDGPALTDEPATAILSQPRFQSDGEIKATKARTSHQLPVSSTANSIAVLPFMNLSSDVENEYFCDGLAEELLNALAKIDDLKVAARTSAFSFKGRNTNVSEIGTALGVRTVLEGSVRKSGNRLRISVQLVNAADGYQLWSERYDREMGDIFRVQDEITLAVVDALKLTLLVREKAMVLKRGTDNAGAYEFYLRGLFYLNKRTIKDLQRSTEYFTEAIGLDPDYALAYAGLAYAFALLSSYRGEDPLTAMPKAREAALKALSIDDTLAEAHTAFATILNDFDLDFAAAEREFKRGIELNPNHAEGRHFYGQMLRQLGRHEEALAELRRALELDPVSHIIRWNYGSGLFVARRYDDAIEHLEKTAELDPGFALAHYTLAAAYLVTGERDKCVDEFAKYQELMGDRDMAASIRASYEGRNWPGFLQNLIEKRVRFDSPWHNPAIFHAALGENDKAFAELEAAFENRDSYMVLLKVDPRLDPLRGDPRFEELLLKIGLGSTSPPIADS